MNHQERNSNVECVPRYGLMHLEICTKFHFRNSLLGVYQTFVIIKIRIPRLKLLASAFKYIQIAPWLMISTDVKGKCYYLSHVNNVLVTLYGLATASLCVGNDGVRSSNIDEGPIFIDRWGWVWNNPIHIETFADSGC